jgi:spore germination protein GerM
VSAASWFFLSRQSSPVGGQLTVYYTKADGQSEIPWSVSMRPQASGESAAEHLHNAALYAATQAVAGPASNVNAVRFPTGTHVLSVDVTGSTAVVDLSKEVESQTGTFGESGEFKSLVWTLTGLPGIHAVGVRIAGEKLSTLPGGHLELDQPLQRSDF